ncbi:hypothetical protein BRYFOR_08437 [Marvinbryantia formatexigens DSM 14469]|uniref:Uncharacterized protein n=1 Tax=Marvinbryantia formatexigens DSM 14469 TaxID=478749 RepID=C6LIJ9_9FIRM|nr:hypothetical protein BRYFOR_08437 [Marvinbryantia formatexigens DSM 14469]
MIYFRAKENCLFQRRHFPPFSFYFVFISSLIGYYIYFVSFLQVFFSIIILYFFYTTNHPFPLQFPANQVILCL